MNLRQGLSDFYSEFQISKSREYRLRDEVEKKSREICLLCESVEFESDEKRKVEEELREKEERLQKLTEDVENQKPEKRDELKEKEKRYQKLMEDKFLETQNRILRDELKEQQEKGKEKEEKYNHREALIQREIEKMREILDCERLDRMKIEEDLKRSQEECEKAKELYDKLLVAVKKNGLRDDEEEEDATTDELRKKNCRLEDELGRWKRKFLNLNDRVSRLEFDRELLMKKRNSEKNKLFLITF